ncbi:methyltransferase family protein [Pseudahrensia aquimaris]|uniref:Methyltransferase family protein n=1 Tax=Pseudahrensia aquimaris TaxID=744461 RepID=A0ABW3FH56_9HYPH
MIDGIRLGLGYGLIFLLPLVITFWSVIHLGHSLWKKRPIWQAYSAALVALAFCAFVVNGLRVWLLGTDLGESLILFVAGMLIYLTSLVMARSVRRHLAFRTFAGVPEIKGEAQTLITSGPFSAVRHPRYLMVIVGVIGWAFMSNYAGVYAVSVVSIVALVGITQMEERELQLRFGDAYRAYQANVPMLLPKASAWRLFFTDETTSP